MRLLSVLITIFLAVLLAHFLMPLPKLFSLPLLGIGLVLLLISIYHEHQSVWLWLFLSSYAWANHSIANYPILQEPVICETTLELIDFPKPAAPTGERTTTRIRQPLSCPLAKNTTINLRAYQTLHWQPGEQYTVNLKLLPSDRHYLGAQHIDARASLIEIIAPHPTKHFSIPSWRKQLSARISERFYAQNQRWWQALLIGQRTSLTTEDWQTLRQSGTSHLLAISGLHLAMIAGTIFWLIQIICAYIPVISQRVEPRTVALITALTLSLLYAMISGSNPPVLRAWWMLAIFTLHWFYVPIRSAMQALILAAIILLLQDVYLIYSTSAWLSFYATAIVILGYRRFKHYDNLRLWLIIQGIITIALWPLVWALFGGISIIAYIVNLLVIPWLGILLLLGYLGLLIPAFASLADSLFNHYFNTIEFFASFKWGYIIPDWQPPLWIAACFCLAVIMWLVRAWYRFFSLLLVGIILTIATIHPQNAYFLIQESPLIAIITYDHHTYLINAGYRHKNRGIDQAQSQILPYLRQHHLTPEAVIFTQTGKRATTATQTIIKHYPDIKLYSVVLPKGLPFSIEYCPSNTNPPLTFYKRRYCHAQIADEWIVKHKEIKKL